MGRKTSAMFLVFSSVVLVVTKPQPQTQGCGFLGDCRAGDGDFACPGDCSLFVKCSNGIPSIMSCSPGTFFDEALDQCVWNCPWTETTTSEVPTTTTATTTKLPTTFTTTTTTTTITTEDTTTTTTTMTTTTTEASTSTEPLPENCFVEACLYGTDGPEYYRNYEDDPSSCRDYFQCDFGVWCKHSCKWGLIFDSRDTGLVRPGCKLPPLVPNCILPDHTSNLDLEAAKHMENSSVVLDVERMNTPMCTFLNQETCKDMDIFQPVYGYGPRGGQCTKEFKICYRGWSCFMRCDGDLVLDVGSGQCVHKDMLEFVHC